MISGRCLQESWQGAENRTRAKVGGGGGFTEGFGIEGFGVLGLWVW